MANQRERAWDALKQLRDFTRANVGKTMEISPRMLTVLDEAVGAFQNDPPCPSCGSEAPDGATIRCTACNGRGRILDDDIPF